MCLEEPEKNTRDTQKKAFTPDRRLSTSNPLPGELEGEIDAGKLRRCIAGGPEASSASAPAAPDRTAGEERPTCHDTSLILEKWLSHVFRGNVLSIHDVFSQKLGMYHEGCSVSLCITRDAEA
jgi:hypothetical protein